MAIEGGQRQHQRFAVAGVSRSSIQLGPPVLVDPIGDVTVQQRAERLEALCDGVEQIGHLAVMRSDEEGDGVELCDGQNPIVVLLRIEDGLAQTLGHQRAFAGSGQGGVSQCVTESSVAGANGSTNDASAPSPVCLNTEPPREATTSRMAASCTTKSSIISAWWRAQARVDPTMSVTTNVITAPTAADHPRPFRRRPATEGRATVTP